MFVASSFLPRFVGKGKESVSPSSRHCEYQPVIVHDWDHQVPSRTRWTAFVKQYGCMYVLGWSYPAVPRGKSRVLNKIWSIKIANLFVGVALLSIIEQVSLYLIAVLAPHLHPSYFGCTTWILGEAFSPSHNGLSCKWLRILNDSFASSVSGPSSNAQDLVTCVCSALSTP